jgi:hypothetical protein
MMITYKGTHYRLVYFMLKNLNAETTHKKPWHFKLTSATVIKTLTRFPYKMCSLCYKLMVGLGPFSPVEYQGSHALMARDAYVNGYAFSQVNTYINVLSYHERARLPFYILGCCVIYCGTKTWILFPSPNPVSCSINGSRPQWFLLLQHRPTLQWKK